MKEYKCYLFDWDGTLAHTLDAWYEACRYVFAERKIEVTDSQIYDSFGGFENYFTRYGIENVEDVIVDITQQAITRLVNINLFEGATELLENLKSGSCKLALITSSRRVVIESTPAYLQVAAIFDVVVTGSDVNNLKPDPEPLEKAIIQMGDISKDKCVMVGDSDKDLAAAQAFGIDAILFHSEEHGKYYDKDKLVQDFAPSRVISELSQLAEIVHDTAIKS